MKQYDEIMDKIEVTEEMKIRILKNIQNSDVVSKSADHIMPLCAVKKYLSVAAVLFSYLVFRERLSKKSFAGLVAIVAGTLVMLASWRLINHSEK